MGQESELTHELRNESSVPQTSRIRSQADHVEHLSPSSANNVLSSGSPGNLSSWASPASLTGSLCEDVRQRLQQVLAQDDGSTARDAMQECIDLYLRYLYPATPLLDENSIRATAAFAFPSTGPLLAVDSIHIAVGSSTPVTVPSSIASVASEQACSLSRPGQAVQSWRYARSLSLLCAVCAFACSVVPEHLFSARRPVAGRFLGASRDFLSLCHDYDIEQPEASSIIIRYLHSLCNHAAGNARVSWHGMGEALRLAQEMRLYDEASLAGLDLAEAQLRRAVYWQLYAGDRSAAILNDRPFTFHDLLLDAPATTRQLTPDDMHLRDLGREHNTTEFLQCLNNGFNLSSRLFGTASTLIMDLRMLRDFSERSSSGSADLVKGQSAAVIDSLIAFRYVLDDMPDWLQCPWQLDTHCSSQVAEYHRGCFWIQHVNLKATFHCLRMIIVQIASQLGLTSVLGYSKDPRLVAMEQAEIARDFLECIEKAPFEALQLNGESCVEKIRQVGAVLLRLSHDSDNQPVALRAGADFQVLLNILARLDSKASDSLSQEVHLTWS